MSGVTLRPRMLVQQVNTDVRMVVWLRDKARRVVWNDDVLVPG